MIKRLNLVTNSFFFLRPPLSARATARRPGAVPAAARGAACRGGTPRAPARWPRAPSGGCTMAARPGGGSRRTPRSSARARAPTAARRAGSRASTRPRAPRAARAAGSRRTRRPRTRQARRSATRKRGAGAPCSSGGWGQFAPWAVQQRCSRRCAFLERHLESVVLFNQMKKMRQVFLLLLIFFGSPLRCSLIDFWMMDPAPSHTPRASSQPKR
jgi:hypothetical protein